jgi:cytochrome c
MDEVDDKTFELVEAALSGDVETARQCLNAGASFNTRVGNENAVSAAAKGDNPEMIKLLVEAGADPGRTWESCNLHLAIDGSPRVEVLKALLVAGANANASGHVWLSPLYAGFAPLHLAAQEGCPDSVDVLLQHGAHLHATSSEGKTALDYSDEAGHKEVSQLLRQSGCVPARSLIV